MTEYAMQEKHMSRIDAAIHNAIEIGRDILYESKELMRSGALADAYTAELAKIPDCVAGYYYCNPFAFKLGAMTKLPRVTVRQVLFDIEKEAICRDAAETLPVMRENTRLDALLYYHEDKYAEQKAEWAKGNIAMRAGRG